MASNLASAVTVGPIVGHTTDTTVRLWGRGERQRTPGGSRRCHGVAQLLAADSHTVLQARYFKLLAEDDYTGSVDFDGLEPATHYRYRMGFFHSDSEPFHLLPPQGLDLRSTGTGSFHTAPSPGPGPLSFVFGSCRHPSPLPVDSEEVGDRGDRIFRTIQAQLEQGLRTDAVLMLGDQIYADVLRSDRTWPEYCENYRRIFRQPGLRGLMSRVPTYMLLDDHEIADNWSADRMYDPKLSEEQRVANKARYFAAMMAYRSYQLVHGPALVREGVEGRTNTLDGYWYTFQLGPARFFMMDTRTERSYLAAPPEMIGPRQLDAFKQWLLEDREGLKFVGSSVPFFPDVKLAGYMEWERKDKWAGFLLQRQKLLEFMRDEGVKRVVFLSGDVHVSFWSELRSTSRPDFQVLSLVSSAFNAPMFVPPFGMFEKEGILDGQADFVVRRSGGYTAKSNFTRVTWNEPELRVEVFERKGEKVADSRFSL
ncbi:MAG TPA: alkaline phosphatase D family protein [Myxococcaceae bacterium]|nr:alkaline phosphatase D family protein [Myxococcaceae bacterium]